MADRPLGSRLGVHRAHHGDGLQPANPVLADGYTATVERRGAVTFVRVHDASGAQAAKGQMAAVGEAVVVDRVVTEKEHQRHGLGGFVMRTLADRALADGAVLGVLGATDEGRALYETLGWKKHVTLAEAVYRRQSPAVAVYRR